MKYDMFDWFFGCVDGAKAEEYLNEIKVDGCFLVRISSTKKYYVLTLYCGSRRPRIGHYHIYQTTSGRFRFHNEEVYYTSLPALICQHMKEARNLPCNLRCTVDIDEKSVINLDESAAVESNRPQFVRVVQPIIRPAPKVTRNTLTVTSPRPNPPTPTGQSQIKRDSLRKWEIQRSELKFLKVIGKGSFGLVRQATLRDQVLVAVKTVIPGKINEVDFVRDIQSMVELAHPNIVRTCGICYSETLPISIVTEYMSHGSLQNYLVKHKEEFMQERNRKMLTRICAQVASGMAYLEDKNVVHMNLNCENCLVGDTGIVKVGDCSMTKYLSTDETKAACLIPPEVTSQRRYSSKSDVWTFGLLMWEVYSCGENPNGNLEPKEIIKLILKGYILDHPEAAGNEEYNLMIKCWLYNPEGRPSFSEIKPQLMKLAT